VRTFNGSSLCFVGKELVYLGGRSVEDRDFESVVGHIEHEVLPHNGEANQSNIASSFWHSFCPLQKLYGIAAGRDCASGSAENAGGD
jgi:hypothetical protein